MVIFVFVIVAQWRGMFIQIHVIWTPYHMTEHHHCNLIVCNLDLNDRYHIMQSIVLLWSVRKLMGFTEIHSLQSFVGESKLFFPVLIVDE